jgi:hypothetical protein
MSKSEKKVEESQEKENAGPTVKWDGSKMNSSYANVCNVTSTREEINLLFGTNQTWVRGGQEVVVELTDRIILNPFAAKRLSALLQNVVGEYEKRFGDIQIGTQPSEVSSH